MKIKNILIILLTITTIASTSTAVYFGLNQKNEEENPTQDVQIQEENKEDDEKIENKEDQEKYTKIFKLNDEINVINKAFPDDSGYSYIIDRYSASALGVSAVLTNNNTVRLTFTKLEGTTSFPNAEQYYNTYNIEINFTDKKVQNIYSMGAGQSASANCLLFLMEDGTVEYMPLAYAIANNDFRSYGKIEGIEDIVDMVSASISGPGSGYATVLVIQEDGTAYDIGEQLFNINNQYKVL